MAKLRLQGKKFHLTYKTHINHDKIRLKLQEQNELVNWSIVHEEGHEDTPYEHTHALVEFREKIRTSDARVFDIEDIHPNINPVTTKAHWDNTWGYHEKEPIGEITRSEPRGKHSEDLFQAIEDAPDLASACRLAGIEPKTVQDVATIRRNKKRPREECGFDITTWTRDIDPNFRVFFIHGPSDTGKTQWALAHFKNPLVCRDTDDLKDFVPGFHDGIVFDDMSFSHWPRTSVIHLLDWDLDSSIRCRNTNAFIPKHTKKIFTSNTSEDEVFGPQEHAKARRITRRLHVIDKLYKKKEENLNIIAVADSLPKFVHSFNPAN